MAAQPQRDSSLQRYEYIWKRFNDWHNNKFSTDPLQATVVEVADYLLYLKNKGRQFATILSHKSAICSTLVHLTGNNYSENTTIRSLLQSFKKRIVKPRNKVPDWNFNIVLAALRVGPFEPLDTVDLKYVTMKCLFLTAWASAARVSELHALSVNEGLFLMDSKIDLWI